MIALLRLSIIGFAILTVIYVILSIWSRLKRRGKLAAEWDDGDVGIGAASKDAYIQQGLKEYDRSLRRKLILGVYVVPVLVVGTIIYLTNY